MLDSEQHQRRKNREVGLKALEGELGHSIEKVKQEVRQHKDLKVSE